MVFLRHFTIPGDGGLGRAVWTLLHPRQSGAVARCNAGPCRYTVRCHGIRYIVKHIDHIAMEKHGTSSINTLQMEVFLSLNITENLRVSMEVSFFSWQKRTIMGRSSINGGSKRWEMVGKTWKKIYVKSPDGNYMKKCPFHPGPMDTRLQYILHIHTHTI